MATCYKKRFKDSRNFGCEKVAKTYFVDFDFDFLAKEKGQRAHFGYRYWSINILDNPLKN